MTDETAKEVIDAAKARLEEVRFSLQHALGNDALLRRTAIRNVAVFGKSVIDILKHLRNVPDLGANLTPWRTAFEERIKTDPHVRQMIRVRNAELKDGRVATGVTLTNVRLNLPDDMIQLGPPPPYAQGFFIGDQIGGSGWNVVLPDGVSEKYYVTLPPGMVESADVIFADTAMSATKACRKFVQFLEEVVRSADETFLS